MAQALVKYGGLSDIRGACLSLARGAAPSSFTLWIKPQDGLNAGEQTLQIGNDSSSIGLTGCILSTAYVRKHWFLGHTIWSVTGFDRRWKWRLSSVSGDYNRRAANGTLDTSTQKSPAELVQVIGQALGESINTSRMPSGVFPRALWKGQRADLALQAICDYVACEIVLNPISNGVEIWPLGQGQTAPTLGSQVLPKYRYVPRSDVPGIIEVHGGPSLYQHKLQLKAVGRNYTDGRQKLLAHLEYKPSTGWETESPFSFPGVTSANNRINAFEEVYRTFRVTGQSDGSLAVPNCPVAVNSVDQYVLNDYLLDFETDLEGKARNLPCHLSGDYWAYTDLPNNTSDKRFTGRFVLDADRRTVNTDFPVFKLSSSGAINEPVLNLTTSYRVNATWGEPVHIVRSGGSSGSGKLILHRPELFASYSSSTAPGGVSNTEFQANNEADRYVQIFQSKYQDPTACETTYATFVPGTLDGRVCQAVWMVHPARGCETRVAENEEIADIYAVGLNERRRRQALDRLVEAAR